MRSRIHGLVAALGVSAVLFAPSSIASRTVGTTATTGLLSLTPGHLAILTLADVGIAKDAVVPAQLEILDGENRILATTRGELRPGQPLELAVTGDVVTGLRLPVRARVHVFDKAKRFSKQVRSRPVLTFEILDIGTGDVHVGLTCPFPGGSGVEFNCTCVIDDLAVPE